MHLLIEDMPTILHVHPGTHCLIVGENHVLEPDYLMFLEGLVKTLDLKEHVQILLQRSSPTLVQTKDVAVHVSENEPFGIVVLEAMALGKPVVAGNTGGPTELITDGENGVLVPFGDSGAVAQAVCRFLADPETASQIGSAARVRAQEWSVELFVSTFSSALEQGVRPVDA